ncbi:MAG: pilus assembly FimT family protein [Bacillota bacterium]
MKDQKGFTLIELLAVIVISTTVLVPLLSGLIGNFEVNTRMQSRKAASSITLTTVDAFNKVPFQNFENLFLYRDSEEMIMEITPDDCSDFIEQDDLYVNDLNSETLCEMIFDQEWNSIQFNEPGTFKVYAYPYSLDEDEKDAIMAREDIPDKVLNEIRDLTPSTQDNPDVYRLTVWIQYDDEYEQDIVSSGVVTRE